MATRLVVGLGNPGSRYADTRHNVGFLVIDAVARRHGVAVDRHQHRALLGDFRLPSGRVILVKPQTFMNLSGESVGPLARYFKVKSPDILVIHDDMDLPLGRLRLRQQGSSGGHNGVQSVMDTLGTPAFPRVRLGIGRPAPEWSGPDWVLARFTADEEPVVASTVALAAEALDVALTLGFAAAMNRFNK